MLLRKDDSQCEDDGPDGRRAKMRRILRNEVALASFLRAAGCGAGGEEKKGRSRSWMETVSADG
ncbi:MAG TPA: hypothetical protein VHU83_15545 [Bryobacteraceae bacterium]|nr:hypothetical protein [Bryobacteraceae bacterium]